MNRLMPVPAPLQGREMRRSRESPLQIPFSLLCSFHRFPHRRSMGA